MIGRIFLILGILGVTLFAASVLWPRTQPTLATGGAIAVSTGLAHTCAISISGELQCWGANGSGELGDGTTNTSLLPRPVSGFDTGVTAVDGGENRQFGPPQIDDNLAAHTCALTTSGGVKCWGNNQTGQIGDGTTIDRFSPVDVSGLASGVAAISSGSVHTCALTTGGGVKCWGINGRGELGDGTTTGELCPHSAPSDPPQGSPCRATPTNVIGLSSGIVSISAGGPHTCAVTEQGSVKCWGPNTQGQLGNGTTEDESAPVDVVSLDDGIRAVAAGGEHSCALTTSGLVECWGRNDVGQLGDGTTTNRLVPTTVVGLTDVVAISAGFFHTCAATTSGTVKCWGGNFSGNLGDGTTTQSTAPITVTGLGSGVTAITAGGYHTCAVTTSGDVKCWGNNAVGQLGDGTTTERTTPVDVVGLEKPPVLEPTPTTTLTPTPAAVPTQTPPPADVGVLIGSLSLDVGELGSLELSATGLAPPGLGAWTVDVGYDPVIVSPVQCASELPSFCGVDFGPDTVRVSSSTSPGITGDATLASITFVCEAVGSTALTLTLEVFADDTPGDPQDIDAQTFNGMITCNPAPFTPTPLPTPTPTSTPPLELPGDANCDGDVNAIDAALVLQFVAGLLDTLGCEDAADVNADGTLNSIDAALILQFTAGLLSQLPP